MTISAKVRRQLTDLKGTVRVPHEALRLAEQHGKLLSRRHGSTLKAAWECISLAKSGCTVDNFTA